MNIFHELINNDNSISVFNLASTQDVNLKIMNFQQKAIFLLTDSIVIASIFGGLRFLLPFERSMALTSLKFFLIVFILHILQLTCVLQSHIKPHLAVLLVSFLEIERNDCQRCIE